MKSVKLKQFGLAFSLLVSLFVSPISAACICSDQTESLKTEVSSCHEDSETAASAEEHHQSSDSEDSARVLNSNDDCCCIQPAPKVSAKSETVKVEKQSATISQSFLAEIALTPKVVSVKTISFETPFYLTDFFYNLAPGRAPPVL